MESNLRNKRGRNNKTPQVQFPSKTLCTLGLITVACSQVSAMTQMEIDNDSLPKLEEPKKVLVQQESATDAEVAAALSGAVDTHDSSEFEHKRKPQETESKPKVIANKNSKSKIMISRNSEVINEAYEGLDVNNFSEAKGEAKQKPAPKKKVEKKRKVEKKVEKKDEKPEEMPEEKPEKLTDPGEA